MDIRKLLSSFLVGAITVLSVIPAPVQMTEQKDNSDTAITAEAAQFDSSAALGDEIIAEADSSSEKLVVGFGVPNYYTLRMYEGVKEGGGRGPALMVNKPLSEVIVNDIPGDELPKSPEGNLIWVEGSCIWLNEMYIYENMSNKDSIKFIISDSETDIEVCYYLDWTSTYDSTTTQTSTTTTQTSTTQRQTTTTTTSTATTAPSPTLAIDRTTVTIKPGETATFNYSTYFASQLSISGNSTYFDFEDKISTQIKSSGSFDIESKSNTPAGTYNFTVNAVGYGSYCSKTITIIVEEAPVSTTTAAPTPTLTIDRTTVTIKPGGTATFNYSTTYTDNLSISGNSTYFDFENQISTQIKSSGSFDIESKSNTPAGTYDFTVNAVGYGSYCSKTITIIVEEAPLPSFKLYSNKVIMYPGESTTLVSVSSNVDKLDVINDYFGYFSFDKESAFSPGSESTVMDFEFTCEPNTPAGMYTLYFIASNDYQESNMSMYTLTVEVLESKTPYGDANDNGDVEVADAVFILQGLADPSSDEFMLSTEGAKKADCHNNGNGVDAEDALAVLKLKANLIDSLPYYN